MAAMTEDQRRQRAIDAERSLGVNRKSDEHQDDPSYVRRQKLADLLEGGHVDPLAGGGYYSYRGGGSGGSGGDWAFLDAEGRETGSGTAAQRAAAAADQALWSDPQQGGGGGGAFNLGSGGSISDRVNAVLSERLGGNSQFFGPKATAQAKAGAFETTQRRLRSNNRQAAEDAIDSGQGEGDAYNQELNSNRRGAAEDYGGASRDIDTSMRAGAYQAQSEALQSILEQSRAEAEQAIAREGNSIQRERISADQRIAERQIQAQIEQTNRGYQAEQASGRANRDWQDQRDQQQRQWDLEDYYRNSAAQYAPRP
jgi:hypothetical protein